MSEKPHGIWIALGQVGSIGAMLAACIFIGAALGIWLDRVLHTQPWLMLVGLGLGVVSGFYHVVRMLPRKEKKP